MRRKVGLWVPGGRRGGVWETERSPPATVMQDTRDTADLIVGSPESPGGSQLCLSAA